ncbi:MAG: hypothetical protein ACLFRB_03820 [Thiohalorhabdus sp.]|uniref:hypothetical protein n=1 Tax=Thiohalorhabdus sp. TaxID=3094134 RepID=UPI0039805287
MKLDPGGRRPPPEAGGAFLAQPSAPLWKRVPSRDPEGRPLADFMMLIPGLRDRPESDLRATVAEIEAVFAAYRPLVVFADLNLRLNLLWVSLRPAPGMCLEVAAAIKSRVPEALLVANRREAMGR